MEYPSDVGHRGEGSELIYLQSGQQFQQAQALATHNGSFYQGAQPFHQFVDNKFHEMGFGKMGEAGAGQELLVPACPGSSGSSDASDEGLLRYAFPEPFLHQEAPRCDSSRSEAGESTCSSMSSGSGPDDGMVRVPLPLLLPQGFTPGYLHQPGLVRVGPTSGLKLVKPGELGMGTRGLCDDGMYYMRPEGNVVRAPATYAGPASQPAPPQPLHPVPVGWRRLVVDNAIIYLTASNVALSTMDQVKLYLQSTGTCKCGLECPVHCDQLFNFNPKVPSRPWDASDSEMNKLCNHKRKTPDPVQPVAPHPADPGFPRVPAHATDLPIPLPPAPTLAVNVKEPAPTKKKKERRKKQATYSGVSVSQLLAQRERERALAMAAAANGPRWPTPPPPPPPPSRMPVPLYPEAFALRPQDPFTAMFPPGGVGRPRSIPPWHQARFAVRKPLSPYERVPPLQQHMPPPPHPLPALDESALRRKHKPYKTKRKPHEPSFMDDPNGYLAQQTALLHNTIARPNFIDGVPLASNVLHGKRSHHPPCGTAACGDCNHSGSVTSTVVADPRPIQGGTVSTSNGSPTPRDASPMSLCALPAQSPGNILVSSSFDARAPATSKTSPGVARRDMAVVSSMQTSTTNGHILVSSTGQYLGGLKLNQLNAPVGTVLVNAPFMLQPGMMAVDTGLGHMGHVLVDNPPPLLSPDRKKKAKKRKGTPLGSPILQMSPGNNMVLNHNFSGVQSLTLVQGMGGMGGNSPINVLQPVVHNFPFQQFLVPGLSALGNMGNMVMTHAHDGSTTLVPDHGMQLQQLQPLLTNTSFITTPTGMLIRSPNNLVSQVSPPEYIHILPQSNAAVVQQNTMVQQQAMMGGGGGGDKALELEIIAAGTMAADVSTQTGQSKETSHTFCQTVGSPPDTTTGSPAADTTTDDQQTVSSSVADDKLRTQTGYLSPNARQFQDGASVGSSHSGSDVDLQTMLSEKSSPSPGYLGTQEAVRELGEGDLVWGAVQGSPAWPGQLVGPVSPAGDVLVRWFGGIASHPTRVQVADLQTLSQGLDAHHQASNTSRRARKLRVSLEAAIQEAMAELDKMATQRRKHPNPSGRSRRSLR